MGYFKLPGNDINSKVVQSALETVLGMDLDIIVDYTTGNSIGSGLGAENSICATVGARNRIGARSVTYTRIGTKIITWAYHIADPKLMGG